VTLRRVFVIRKSSPGWLILHGHEALNRIEKLQALTVDSHRWTLLTYYSKTVRLRITYSINNTKCSIQQAQLVLAHMQWLTLVLNSLRESWTRMGLVRRSNSVTGLQRISRTCSLRALNSRTNLVRRSNSMNRPDLLVASLQHIGRNTHCEPSLFHAGTGDNYDCYPHPEKPYAPQKIKENQCQI
jgi:hypothetical protein